jgi:N-acetylglucosaminyldiphosphoundecaprenol N-acetyl-beta-D-mannosaminyltransferase
MQNPRFSLLGTQVQGLSLAEIADIIAESVKRRERRLILYHNLHSVYLYHHDEHVATLYDKADYVYVDGMGLIFLARVLGLPLRHCSRTCLLDSFEMLVAEAAHRNWRILYLGSKPVVGARGAEILVKQFPELQIATLDGYFDARVDSSESKAIVRSINTFQPDVLLVGMGMPRQERWLLANLKELPQTAIVTAGATMDYLAGEIAQPPRWAGPLGLYWLFRLFSEPRRLWRRYLLEPWYLVGFLLAQSFNKTTAFPEHRELTRLVNPKLQK